MVLRAKLIKGAKLTREEESVLNGRDGFHKQLERGFVEVCKKLGISVPLWVGKNTREFARHRRTSFQPDQFIEQVEFDRLEIRLYQE